ncbi:MAG TPA: hypothetical protein VF600_03585 [Abditibacteriaceae bacterium]|jgi:hypothetical protein
MQFSLAVPATISKSEVSHVGLPCRSSSFCFIVDFLPRDNAPQRAEVELWSLAVYALH